MLDYNRKALINAETGRLEGTTKAVNKYAKDTKFIQDINIIRLQESSANLYFLERGRRLAVLKEEYNLTDYELSDQIGLDRSYISNLIRMYKTSLQYGFTHKDKIPDRVMMAALQMSNKDKANKFIISYKEYKEIGFNTLVKVFKGTQTIAQLKAQIKKNAEVRIKLLEELEKHIKTK
jgi:transcriptional regulator with XRE-family HTH domain